MGQHPTKDEDRLAMNEGLGLSFMALEAAGDCRRGVTGEDLFF